MSSVINIEEVDNGYILTLHLEGAQKRRIVCATVQEVEKKTGEWLRLN